MGEMADLAEDMALKEDWLQSVNSEIYEQKTNQELVQIIDAYVEDDWLSNDDFLFRLRDWFQQKKYFTAKQRQAVIKHLAQLPELD